MRLGSRERPEDNVFLLSTTHGAETPALAAAISTMQIYRTEPVVEHLHRQGERLRLGLSCDGDRHGLGEYSRCSAGRAICSSDVVDPTGLLRSVPHAVLAGVDSARHSRTFLRRQLLAYGRGHGPYDRGGRRGACGLCARALRRRGQILDRAAIDTGI